MRVQIGKIDVQSQTYLCSWITVYYNVSTQPLKSIDSSVNMTTTARTGCCLGNLLDNNSVVIAMVIYWIIIVLLLLCTCVNNSMWTALLGTGCMNFYSIALLVTDMLKDRDIPLKGPQALTHLEHLMLENMGDVKRYHKSDSVIAKNCAQSLPILNIECGKIMEILSEISRAITKLHIVSAL